MYIISVGEIEPTQDHLARHGVRMIKDAKPPITQFGRIGLVSGLWYLCNLLGHFV